ncbi:MAG: FG-GAP-like repeat-containing protein [Xanthomonadales bacterium]|nr:FG-GAP-like repeat-containing protein [Xanthomonadales bacterium]
MPQTSVSTTARNGLPERPRIAAILAALSGLLLGACERSDEASEPAPDPQVLTQAIVELNNRGVGQMGYFDYSGARETFEVVVEGAPDWIGARLNLAIATLNRQEPGDELLALELINQVLAEAPENLRAHYLAGILRFNQGETDAALEHFETVFRGDPDDAYAAYFVGQCRLQLGEPGAAYEALSTAIRLDPYLRSAHYGAFLAAQRLGLGEEARSHLADYQALEVDPRSRMAEIKYTRMGSKAEAIPFREPEPPPSAAFPAGSFPDEIRSLTSEVSGAFAAPYIDPDGHRWLAVFGPEAPLQVLDLDTGRPLDLPFNGQLVRSLAWGDYDNDGRVDLYLGRAGTNTLWRQGEGGWLDVTEATLTGGEDGLASVDVLFLDADHDGDLDLFVVNAGGPDELFNNNGDGTFRGLAADHGLAGDGSGGEVLALDLDSDRDLDLVVTRPGDHPAVYLNDRLWQYQRIAGPAISGTAAIGTDLDADGAPEVCGLEPGQLICSRYASGAWSVLLQLPIEGSPTRLGLIDADADGRWEFLVGGPAGWEILTRDGERLASGTESLLGLAHPDPGAGPALILQHAGGIGMLGPQEGPYLTLTFRGQKDPGASMRSNLSGLGTRYVVRAGSTWTAGWALPQLSGPAAGLQPVAIGLGTEGVAQYVAIDWSDGVFQTELDLVAGRHYGLTETQRQLASCPVLFGWDGNQFSFLSDVLGVGGIGFAIGPGEYAEPRPWEHFRIDADRLMPRDGRLTLRLTEPMEEIAYVDRATLEAIEYPAGLVARLDERMATDGRAPSGELLLFDGLIRPVSARDRQGQGILESLAALDQKAAPPGPVDPRFLGMLAEANHLTLEFDVDLSRLKRPVLVMDGWVEYGYSQTSFAAWQAGRRYEPPTLEARGANGEWVTVAPSFGYPAGMPREAAYVLPALPSGTRALRLTTNMEIYFDQLAIGDALEDVTVSRQELPLAAAQVERIGFPKRTDGPQKQPHYDYSDRQPFWDVRYQRGFYTALGPATELVATADNGLAVIGPGDALELAFDAGPLPPRAHDRARSLVLRLDGWAKDMDLYTRNGETVEPLPVQEQRNSSGAELHARYNTRFQSGR